MKYFAIIVSIALAQFQCTKENTPDIKVDEINFREEMRNFVREISRFSKSVNSDFIVIPQNGLELLTKDNLDDPTPDIEYIKAIDAVGREDLFYGYERDNDATPAIESVYMMAYLDLCVEHGKVVLSTDYCWDEKKMEESYRKNSAKNYVSFAAPDRELNLIPTFPQKPVKENNEDIHNINDVKNYLYLLNPEKFTNRQDYIQSLSSTNYDLLIIDLHYEGIPLNPQEIVQLKKKKNGGERLVIGYMSIGEAENYRFYWQDHWKIGSPDWIAAENPYWEGNFKVKYWTQAWKDIIFGHKNSYLNILINSGFDGVYLDIIDAFEYFED